MSNAVECQVREATETEAKERVLTGTPAGLVAGFMVLLALFQLYTAGAGSFPALIQRGVHLGLVLPVAFLLYPGRRNGRGGRVGPLDWLFAAMALVATLWVLWSSDRIANSLGLARPIDLWLAPLLVIAVLEATRRLLGPTLPILVLLLVFYAVAGPYFPGRWSHRGVPLERVAQFLYLEPEGIFGYIVGISASVIAAFLILGVLLSETGGGQTFIDIAKRLAGRSVGGPAKVSCFSSALFGTVSGSAVANVVVTGIFSIPLMRRLGYRADFAAAVEATNSAGGQLLPPVMGASAFIMAELLGMPYAELVLAAAIPGFLYYWGCFWGIHFWALAHALKPLPREEIPSFRRDILPRCLPFVVPMAALVACFAIGYGPTLAVFYATAASALSYLLLPSSGSSLPIKLRKLLGILDRAGRAIVLVAVLCACAQMVVGLLTYTGLGIKISDTVVSLSGDDVLLCLLLTMVVAIVLGMGVPTTAAYVLAASVCVPPLTTLGVPPLSAHMFVFYFAVISAITPPVCAAVFVAAALAGASWMRTGLLAVALGASGFIVPYMFYFGPALLLQGDTLSICLTVATALVGVMGLSAGLMGYLCGPLGRTGRLLMTASGLLLVDPGLVTDLVAAVFVGAVILLQRARARQALP